MTALTLPTRTLALSLPASRDGQVALSLLTLEDNSGYWLFEDGTRIIWEAGDTGTPMTLAARTLTLALDERAHAFTLAARSLTLTLEPL